MSGSPRPLRLFSMAALAAVMIAACSSTSSTTAPSVAPTAPASVAAPSAPASVAPSEAASPSAEASAPASAEAGSPAAKMIEMYALDGSYLDTADHPDPGHDHHAPQPRDPGPRAAPAASQRRRDRHADVRGPVEGQARRPAQVRDRGRRPAGRRQHRRRRPDRDRPAGRLRGRRLPEDRLDRGPREPRPGDGAGPRPRTTRRACSRRSRRSRRRRKPTASHREPSRSTGRGGSPDSGARIRMLSTSASTQVPVRAVLRRRTRDGSSGPRSRPATPSRTATWRRGWSGPRAARTQRSACRPRPRRGPGRSRRSSRSRSGRTRSEKVSRPKFAGSAGQRDRAAADRGRRRRRRRSSRRSGPPPRP